MKVKKLGLFSLSGLLILSLCIPAYAGMEGAALLVSPVVDNVDNVAGASDSDWNFAVTTNGELKGGDVIKFIFPSLSTGFDLSNISISSISGIALYSSLASSGYGSNLLTNGSLENWDQSDISPSSWEMGHVDGTVDPSMFSRSADGRSGYGIELPQLNPNLGGVHYSVFLEQTFAVNTDDNIQASYYAKSSEGVDISVFYTYRDVVTDDEYWYNFEIGDWDLMASDPTPQHFDNNITTAEYSQHISPVATVPAGITSVRFSLVVIGDSAGPSATIDDASFTVNGVESLQNGGLEDWKSHTPTGYTEGYWGVSANIDEQWLLEQSQSTQAGDSALLMKFLEFSATNKWFGELKSGLTAGTNHQISFYAKKDASAGLTTVSRMAVFDDIPTNATQIYNFQLKIWENYSPVTTEPGAGYYSEKPLTTSYTQFPTSGIPAPARGKLFFALWMNGEEHDIAYFDTLSLQAWETTSDVAGISYYDAVNPIAYGLITNTIPTDTTFNVTFSGIVNGSDVLANLQNLTWQVEAGTPSNANAPYGSLFPTVFTTSATASLVILPPSAPSGFSASSSSTSIDLSWTDNSTNEDSFLLEISDDGGATYTTVSSPAANATSATASGLTPNTAYTFRLSAVNEGGASAYATIASAYTTPAVPSTVSASANGQTSMVVTWNANSNPSGTTYKLALDDDTLIGTTTDTSYTVTGLSAGTSYQFKVSARYNSDDVTYSSYSTSSDAVSTAAVSSSTVITLSTGQSAGFSLGNESHTVTLNEVIEGVSAELTIQSVIFTSVFLQDAATNVDTDANGTDDMTVTVSNITSNGATIRLASYTPAVASSSSGGSSGGRVALSQNTIEAVSGLNPFDDIVNSAVKDLIIQYYNDGIIHGKSETKFEPKSYITRAEALKVVLNVIGENDISLTSTYINPFTDINGWYQPYILLAQSRGIIDGYPDKSFRPNNVINKVEAYKIVMMAKGIPIVAANGFNTYPFAQLENGAWYGDIVYTAYINGFTSAIDPDYNFAPGQLVTREEFVALTALPKAQ